MAENSKIEWTTHTFNPRNAKMKTALQTAIEHIEHMAAWIGKQNAGYSFESLGEDMPGMRAALADGANDQAAAIECAIGGAYEMPDGRKFWIDGPVAREMTRRVLGVLAVTAATHPTDFGPNELSDGAMDEPFGPPKYHPPRVPPG